VTRVELPDGQWADLYDPIKVPERKRRPVVSALVTFMRDRQQFVLPTITAEALSDEDKAAALAAQIDPSLIIAADELNDTVVVALVSYWSFGESVSIEALLDLPADAYKVLSEACAPLMQALMPNFGVTPDTKAPTGS
jgi:hypothetical protein